MGYGPSLTDLWNIIVNQTRGILLVTFNTQAFFNRVKSEMSYRILSKIRKIENVKRQT